MTTVVESITVSLSTGPAPSNTTGNFGDDLISQKAHVPIGVDAILPRKQPTIVLDFSGGTVADLLNMLVSQAPGYEWNEAEDGLIYVRRNNEVSLLNMVMYFPGAENMTRKQIWEDLSNRPEILQLVEFQPLLASRVLHGQ